MQQSVIFLHGLGRTGMSMRIMQQSLQTAGFRTVTVNYPSTRKSIGAIVDTHVAQAVEKEIRAGSTVHFVTHSLGGILVRCYLKKVKRPPNFGRIVMLAPPNRGSEIADYLGESRLMRIIMGPVLGQLGTGNQSFPLQLGPVNCELGVIAGTRSYLPFFSNILPGEDDGLVAVERTVVDGMKDFLAVPCSHTFIMNHPQVIRQTINFLRKGTFV